jgi:uncharacterized protein (TIGR03067 family)
MTRFRGLVAAVAAVLFVGGAFAQEKKPAEPAKEEKKEPAKFDASKLEGKWTVSEYTKDGEKQDTKEMKEPAVFTKDTIKVKSSAGEFEFKYTLDTKTDPVAIDMEIAAPDVFKGAKTKGILKMDGDKLMLAYDANMDDKADKVRPKGFESKKESNVNSFVLTKAKEDKKDEKKEPKPVVDK